MQAAYSGCFLQTQVNLPAPLLLNCWMHSSTFVSSGQSKAMPGCRCAATSLKFAPPPVSSHQTTRIISWHRYAIIGNLITKFDGAEGLEQWSSMKSVDNCIRQTILITRKHYKNQVPTSYYICSSDGEIHVPSVVSSVSFQWQIRKEAFTASSKHLVATTCIAWSIPEMLTWVTRPDWDSGKFY